MPALGTVAFVSTHADGNEPDALVNGEWRLKVPANVESCLADAITTVDLHQTVNIPTGYIGLISNVDETDLTGAAECVIASQVIIGDGSAKAISIKVVNTSASNQSPTADTDMASLVVLKLLDYKHVEDGTWT